MVDKKILNFEYPYTELFSYIKNCEVSGGISRLSYETRNIKIMYNHVNNSISLLLQGIQEITNLILKCVNNGEAIKNELNGIMTLISHISNLIEALYVLQGDFNFELRERGELDFEI